jgi:LytS/YehU family sensor histidine kinase
VKHGLQKKKDGGRLDINILKDGGKLLIEIADNGTGRNGVRAKDKDSNGMGLELMNELFRLYRKLYNDLITAEIYDLPDSGMKPGGTVVKVRIDHGEVAVFN